ncbi:MAG: DUF1697 domain-containing protein [Candidatus Aminicenantes bacterium]|nr:DUF1697 domain-containing protein [Candidatus Aminicenantes bacterium]
MKMNAFISMLRGINVGGQKKIRMAELTNLYESLDLVNVKTYVQSGNVVFDSTKSDASKLANLIEAHIERLFGFSVSIFIRDTNDFQRIIDSNPFLNKRSEDSAKLYVTFLYRPPSEAKLGSLGIPNNEGDEFFVGGKEIYIFCPNGYGRTKFSNTFFEKKLSVPATTRNWNSVMALYKISNER